MAVLNLFNIKFPTIQDKIIHMYPSTYRISAASYPSAKAFPQNGV